MLNTHRILITALLLILSLWSLMQVARYLDPQLHQIELAIGQQNFQPTQLPIKQNILGQYRVKAVLNPGPRPTYWIHIIPDDELVALSINGAAVSLAAFDRAQLRDYTRGIRLELSNLNSNSDNQLEFTLSNQSNPAGFSLRLPNPIGPLAVAGITGALLILILALSRHLHLTPAQYLLLFSALAAIIFYLAHTDSYTRTFDVYEGGGHRDYIEYLIRHHATPPPGEGWEYHQPPLYYIIAAISKTAFATPKLFSDFWGQLLALWFWCIFLFASLATLQRTFRGHSSVLFLASLALCLWPSGIIHSLRIGNDLPLYAFYSLSFYYALAWWKSRCSKQLFLAAIWASMALLTKSNALAMWGVIGGLFLASSYPVLFFGRANTSKIKKVRINFFILAGLFFVTFVLNFGDNLWHYINGTANDWLLSHGWQYARQLPDF
jgi:hypothetical protein